MDNVFKNKFMKINNFPELLNFMQKNNITKEDIDKEMIEYLNDLWVKENPFPNNPDVHYDIRKKKQ